MRILTGQDELAVSATQQFPLKVTQAHAASRTEKFVIAECRLDLIKPSHSETADRREPANPACIPELGMMRVGVFEKGLVERVDVNGRNASHQLSVRRYFPRAHQILQLADGWQLPGAKAIPTASVKLLIAMSPIGRDDSWATHKD